MRCSQEWALKPGVVGACHGWMSGRIRGIDHHDDEGTAHMG